MRHVSHITDKSLFFSSRLIPTFDSWVPFSWLLYNNKSSKQVVNLAVRGELRWGVALSLMLLTVFNVFNLNHSLHVCEMWPILNINLFWWWRKSETCHACRIYLWPLHTVHSLYESHCRAFDIQSLQCINLLIYSNARLPVNNKVVHSGQNSRSRRFVIHCSLVVIHVSHRMKPFITISTHYYLYRKVTQRDRYWKASQPGRHNFPITSISCTPWIGYSLSRLSQ